MNKLKKIIFAVLTTVLVLTTSIFAFASDAKTYLGLPAEQYEALSSTIEENFLTLSYDKLTFMEENSSGYQKEACLSLKNIKKTVGEFVKTDTDATTFETEGKDQVIVTFLSDFKNDEGKTVKVKSKLTLKLFDGDDTPLITAIEFSQADAENATMGEKLGKAGMNTLMGMGTVFIILIFISFIISLLKYVPALINGSKKEEKAQFTETASVVAEPVVEEDETDDTELVAVIAAAIAASENTSTDAFVVRSIRKRR